MTTSNPERERDLELIGTIVAGLAVPYSIAPAMLGAAGAAWAELHGRIGILGYPAAAEVTAMLRERFGVGPRPTCGCGREMSEPRCSVCDNDE